MELRIITRTNIDKNIKWNVVKCKWLKVGNRVLSLNVDTWQSMSCWDKGSLFFLPLSVSHNSKQARPVFERINVTRFYMEKVKLFPVISFWNWKWWQVGGRRSYYFSDNKPILLSFVDSDCCSFNLTSQEDFIIWSFFFNVFLRTTFEPIFRFQ